MRPTFGREYIEAEFRHIADQLSDPLTVYLIGGGALSLRDLKTATKDIDLVVEDGDAYGQLWTVLMELGYTEIQAPGPEYRALGATSCVENDDGCRLDVFNRQVSNKLVLSDGMCERCDQFIEAGPLVVRLVSNEDVFLFKMVAGRDDDVEDMNVLVQAGLDFDVIAGEIDGQMDLLGDDRFITHANEALADLEDRYGVTTPLEDQIGELTNRYYRGLAVLTALDESTTIEQLAEELDTTVEDVEERIAYLEELGRVRRRGPEVTASVE